MSDLTLRISSKDVMGDPLVALQRASVEIAAHRQTLADRTATAATPNGGRNYRGAPAKASLARGAATRLVDEMLKAKSASKRSPHVATTTRK
jgi:hypothetical protein